MNVLRQLVALTRLVTASLLLGAGMERESLGVQDTFPRDGGTRWAIHDPVEDGSDLITPLTSRGKSVLFTRVPVPPATLIQELKYYSGPESPGKRDRLTRVQPPFTNSLSLPAGTHRLEFQFSGLDFPGPETFRFEVMLQKSGENAAWEEAGDQLVAVYRNLSPGEYRFSVRAENPRGARDEAGASLAFSIAPFFWQTGWFRAGGVFLLFGAGWFASRGWSRVSESMKQMEKRMALAADVAHLGMWQWDIVKQRMWMTSTCCELFDVPAKGSITYEEFLSRVHPQDRGDVHEALQEATTSGKCRLSFRLLLPDQTVRWVAARGVVEFDRSGAPLRMLGACIDISERRNAEEAARELSGRLIHAQEDERRRIARELHDDLNQRLALLSVEMELLGRTSNGDGEERVQRLEQVATHIAELSSEVHKLSYRLHPAKLDQLGLVSAVRGFCREVTRQSAIKIEFTQTNVPRDVPREVALCLYRLIQESLQNILRYSRATAAGVRLAFEGDDLKLLITDSGVGFDVETARRKGGLGLVSMEERVRLVHGTIKIQSHPGFGTQITVTVPLSLNGETALTAEQTAHCS